MKTSEHTDKIDAALARVQAELELVTRNKGVEVEGKTTKFSTKFATLSTIHRACKDLLTKHGITLWQGGDFEDKGGERLITRLAHEGQWITSSFPVKAREGAQNFGGGVAFARRWGLQSAVGIFTDDDPDEQRGYQDAAREARPARRAAAPANISAQLAALRGADTADGFAALALDARAAHPIGEPAAAVERTIGQWFVDALGAVATVEALADLRACGQKVKPRGSAVAEALRVAAQRLGAT